MFKILFLCFLAAFALGCGSGSDDNFSNFQSFQNNDAPVRLRFQTVPQRAAGSPFGTINVAIIDFNGLVVTTDTRPVTLSLTQPNGATLSGTTTVNAVNGVASFSGISVNQVGTYTFTASAEGLLPAESAQFSITSGAASTITVLQGFPGPPGPMDTPDNTNSIVIGQAVNPPVRIQVLDAAGNPAPDGTSVTIVTAVDPTGQTQTTGNRVQTVGGVATFDNFVVTSGGGATVFVAAVSGDVRTAPLQTFVLGSELYLYGTINAGTQVNIVRGQVFPATVAPAGVGALTDYDVAVGLEALPNGNLIAVLQRDTAPNDNVFEIVELTPGAPTTIVSARPILGIPAGLGPTDITVDPATGQLYAFYLGLPNSGLYQIDRATGFPSFVGAPGLPAVGEGLAWEPFVENPFIYTGGGATADGLSILDPGTGAATQIAANPVLALNDLVVNPYNTDLFGLVAGTGLFQISKTDGTALGPQPGTNVLSAFTFLSEPTP
ncbi:MAG: hypothetical protein KC800_05735 [Candidatus Eremiobacteraeota bacterium]|nr:hypothetical protein [Candidatus Eremiobacteraeota bacterium]